MIRPSVPRRIRQEPRSQEAPAARTRERFTSGSIAWWTSAAATGYASFAEFLPTVVKAVANTLLAAAVATGSFKAWREQLREGRESREN